jgi:hypothetical protein
MPRHRYLLIRKAILNLKVTKPKSKYIINFGFSLIREEERRNMSDSEATDITYPKLPLESEISKKNKGKKKAKAKGTKDSQAEESNELGASKSDKKKNRPSVESVHNSESEASGRDDKGKEPAVDDESDVPDVETATKFTKKQRKAVTHVIRAGAKNYYGILKLDRTCSDSEIRNAYKRWALKTHPDQNKFKDASEAFKRK